MPDPIGDTALPNGRAMVRSNLGCWWRRRRSESRRWRLSWGITEASDGKGSVEVLPDLGDYPISDGPRVNPRDRTVVIAAFDENKGAEWSDGLGYESEGVLGWSTGEQAHQILMGRRTMEPPIEVWGYNLVHRIHAVWTQGLIQGENHPLITGITFLQTFLRVSQFLTQRTKGKRERDEGEIF